MRSFLGLALSALIIADACGVAVAEDSDRIANIDRAAAEIAAIQKQKGSNGAFAAINSCYQRELASAKSLTLGIEACMAQDIIVSKTTAAFFAGLSPEGRKAARVQEPATVLNDMTQRVVGVYRRFNISADIGRQFNQLVTQRGMETYAHTMYPNQFPAKKN